MCVLGSERAIMSAHFRKVIWKWSFVAKLYIMGTKEDREHAKGNRNICATVLLAIKWYRVVTMS